MANDADNLDADVSALENRLGTPIPDDLRRLFRQGSAEDGPGRLMKPTEVTRDYDLIQQTGINWRECCPIWTDDNSNYAALYLAGPLHGKMCFLDHEPDLSPAYRGLSSFLAALNVAKKDDKDWYEIPTDYPIPTDFYFHQNGQPSPATESEVTGDLEIVDTLKSRLDQLPSTEDDERRYLCFCIIGLTPAKSLHGILEFLLEDEDMWIQERAANVLGFRGFEPAVPQLAKIALHGTGNGVGAAMSALGRIGTADCRDALLKCLPARGTGYAPYLGAALRACGCESTHDRGKWRYRLPGEKGWRAN